LGIWWEFGGNLKQENGKEMGGVVGNLKEENGVGRLDR
jgi:hypothetical protein